MKVEFSGQIFRKILKSDFTKICPIETELFLADRRTNRETDRHEGTNRRFPQFANAPNE